MRKRITVSAALLAAMTNWACAQTTSAFVTTLGRDTLAFEQYRQSGDTVTGDWVTVYGGVMYHHYTILLRPDGRIARYVLSLHRASGKMEDTVAIAFDGDSVTVASSRARLPQRYGAQVDGATFATTIAPLETYTLRARRLGVDSLGVAAVPAFGPYQRNETRLVFYGQDSARLGNPRGPLYLLVDRAGRVQGLSARAATTRMEVTRVAPFDLDAVVRRFPNVADDAPILGIPSLSPRDTTRAVVGDAVVTIDYGRPSVRGRNVFSRGVLGDTLWRVGANAATQLTTTSALSVGGKRLPAGTYSLWIHVSPANSSYELVVNSQHGQWGTEHHFDRDLFAVPLTARHLGNAADQLDIAVDTTGGRSTLRIRWADLELSTPVSVWR